MTLIRRVVSAHDADGNAVVGSDEMVESFEIPALPGTEITNLWGADSAHEYPDGGARMPHETFFPPLGGYRFVVFTVPPDAAANNATTDTAQTERLMPGALATFDPDRPGMHRTASVDLLYVIEGRCELELDNGVRVALNAGDTFVQSGTMHAWRNPYAHTCRIIATIVGARHQHA